MKKKTKQKTLWFLFLPEDNMYDDCVVASFTRQALRNNARDMQASNQALCSPTFERLMGFLPKVPTKITLTWEE